MVGIGEEGGEGVEVVCVDAGNVRVRDDDERKVAESLDAMSKADRKEREREVCGGEKSALGEWGPAMSGFQIGQFVDCVVNSINGTRRLPT